MRIRGIRFSVFFVVERREEHWKSTVQIPFFGGQRMKNKISKENVLGSMGDGTGALRRLNHIIV